MNDKPNIFKIYLQLMKLRVVILLQVTAICAILAHDLMVRSDSISGDRTWIDTFEACIVTIVGGTLAAGGSNAINMVYDRDIDPGMSRTRTRPIPNGWISPRHALLFGITIAIIGSAVFLPFHWKAAFWSMFSVLFYVFVYTIWLKRRTPQNIVIGGIAGSTPPLIGWIVAASANIPDNMNPIDLASPIPWMLFFLIFAWTPPHFWALALYRSGEYKKVGVPMMPDVKGANRTLMESKFYCILLFFIGSVPCFWPEYGLPLAWAFISGFLTLWYSISVWRIDPNEELDSNGRMPLAFASFMRSLGYLAWMFIAFVYIAAVPTEDVWYYSAGFILAVPIVNIFAIKWKDSAKSKNRKVLNAE
ncbi:MAG: protoheme IX farnesyltransferase [Euryarchaeota archaeon]|nr:protoheme IX farnesyltransferase [Euryarchaeota archaeon]